MANEAQQIAAGDQIQMYFRDLARAEAVYYEEIRHYVGRRAARRMVEKVHKEFTEGTFNKAAGIGSLLKGME